MDHLTDAPVANILILAGVIFLAVGIFGRIGGFIGSIFGNIEAGKNSRVLAGVLGLALIVGGGWLHERAGKPGAANPSPTPASSTSPASVPSPAGTAPPAVAADVSREVPKTKARAPQSSPLKTITPVTPEASTSPAASDKSAASLPPISGDNSLVGTWTNPAPSADSIVRLEVAQFGQGLDAHIWNACPSGECDQGIHRLSLSGKTATYDYVVGNRRRMGSLNPYAPKVTLLSVDILEPGTQHRWHHNWVLLKSTLSDKVRASFARYLNAPNQKAFAMAPGGTFSYHFKSASANDATQTALQHCVERGKPGCRVILVNNDATE